jgi:hypothetical protein
MSEQENAERDEHGALMDQAIAAGLDQADAFYRTRDELRGYLGHEDEEARERRIFHLHDDPSECTEPEVHYPDQEEPPYAL